MDSKCLTFKCNSLKYYFSIITFVLKNKEKFLKEFVKCDIDNLIEVEFLDDVFKMKYVLENGKKKVASEPMEKLIDWIEKKMIKWVDKGNVKIKKEVEEKMTSWGHDKKEKQQNENEKKMNCEDKADQKNMAQNANCGLARDDSSTSTRLLDKNWSPLVIRKYQMEGWPMFIGIICDANLNDLDIVVYKLMDEAKEYGFVNGTIQGHRNVCGYLSDGLVKHYNKIKQGVMEGNCVFWYTDKCAISSAYGDLMTHEKCAMEFYSILNMLPHI